MSWSGGKDSCLMLHELLADGGYEVEALVCMMQEGRIGMHGVPEALLDRQAESLGLKLEKVETSETVKYEEALGRVLTEYASRDVRKTAYGDLFLEDVRSYREKFHRRLGLESLYPVWKRPTPRFARDFIDAGFQAIVTCVDASKLDISFAGRLYNLDFLDRLPQGVDPCGENGEFHTFVFNGPRFREPVGFLPLEPVLKDYHSPGHAFRIGFCDLIQPGSVQPETVDTP